MILPDGTNVNHTLVKDGCWWWYRKNGNCPDLPPLNRSRSSVRVWSKGGPYAAHQIHRRTHHIITKLREAEVALSKGQTVVQVSRSLGITEQTYDRWRNEYGGLKIDQVKRLKELEWENTRLKRAVAELTLDKLILKEATEGNF